MNFNEALTGLKSGSYFQRPAWEATGEYVSIMPGMQYIWKILFQPNPSCGNWLPTVDDLEANDWKELVAPIDQK